MGYAVIRPRDCNNAFSVSAERLNWLGRERDLNGSSERGLVTIGADEILCFTLLKFLFIYFYFFKF